MVRSRHLSLRRGTLHPRGRGPSRGRPHPRTEPSRLVEGGAKGALVLGELLHGVRVVVVGRRGIDRRTTVLGWGAWGRVVHVRGHLTHNVSWRRGVGRGRRGHGWRRGLIVNHVGGPRTLWRVLHWVVDGGRGRRRRAIVLLRWRHHVVWVGHYRLARVVPRVVMGRGSRAWAGWKGISRGGGGRRGRVVLDWHRDEVTVFTRGNRGDAECLLGQSSGTHVSRRGRRGIVGGRWRLTIGVVEWGREVHVGLGQVRRGHAEAFGHLGGRGQMHRFRAATRGLRRPHVAVVDVGL